MHVFKPVFAAALMSAAFVIPGATAPHDACTVLTAEHFSKIMGYAATIDKTASTPMACYYTGPAHGGGQFRILTEVASGPQADAMLTSRGSTPPAGSGLEGGTYKEGTIIFSVSIRSADQVKLKALVAEVRHNLK